MKNNTLTVNKVRYNATKINKTNVIYSGECTSSNILTEVIKIEKFQGYSKAFNLPYYLRIKDEKTWKDSTQVTGLFKSNQPLWFSGDYRTGELRTTLLFLLKPGMSEIIIYEFAQGIYLSRTQIEDYLKTI